MPNAGVSKSAIRTQTRLRDVGLPAPAFERIARDIIRGQAAAAKHNARTFGALLKSAELTTPAGVATTVANNASPFTQPAFLAAAVLVLFVLSRRK